MSGIQSTVGLVTGLPIADTVEQLMRIEARPRDLMVSRTKALQAEQTAIADLTAKVLAVQIAIGRLREPTAFAKKSATSSAPDLLSVAVTGKPIAGQYQFTPVQTAQTHQLLSGGFAARDQALGAGSYSFRFGRTVDDGIALEELNGGAGVERGKIRISDRSGASSVIDLRFAQTVDDVIEAINKADAINVTASVTGDRIQLTDNTGLALGNLRVQEVSGGQTAADLGLAGIDVAAAQATGADVLSLHSGLALSALNDGIGVDLSDTLSDLDISLRDGTTLTIDFHKLAAESEGDDGEQVPRETTLGDVLDTLNAADPAKLKAELSADGDRIVLTDLSADNGGTFAVSDPFGGRTAEQLGLTGAAVNGVITSSRLLGGLKTSLLSSLGGGSGLELGVLNLTDRAGASDAVDLSGAETLEDVVAAINAASVNITARVNDARTGLMLTDASGGTGNLVVADGDATETAQKLKLAVDDAVSEVNSGSLDLQVVARQTRLKDLNGGKGVAAGSFFLYNSNGAATSFNLAKSEVKTIGELVDLINEAGIGVEARINDAGDGIALVEKLGGTQSLRVKENGGTTAADLRILRDSVEAEVDGEAAQVIDGSTTLRVELDEDDTLEDLVQKINNAGGGVSASIFSSGSGARPHRLSLISEATGRAGRLVVDGSGAGVGFQEIAEARDALLVYGSAENGAGVLVSSSQNKFDEVVEGLSLTVNGASADPVSVSVATTDSDVVSTLKLFVEQYNVLAKKLDEYTAFNELDNTTGILFGSNETLRIESDLSRLATARFFGAGSIQSLAEVGVNVKDDGTLELDEAKLKAKFAADPQAVEDFFATDKTGVADKFYNLIETIAGAGSSLLVERSKALTRKVDVNSARIEFLNARLERRREFLLTQFYNLELAIGKQQSNLDAIARIQPLPPLVSRSNR
jgi:flagellar hook-associated protein 2